VNLDIQKYLALSDQVSVAFCETNGWRPSFSGCCVDVETLVLSSSEFQKSLCRMVQTVLRADSTLEGCKLAVFRLQMIITVFQRYVMYANTTV
jgi:hypothetical protein